MSIKRAPRLVENFYVLDKKISEDESLSWGARGVLIFLLGKPDNWEVSVQHLINQTEGARVKSGRDAVRAILRELMDAGYIKKVAAHGEDGKFSGYDYLIGESREYAVKPGTDNPAPVEPATANPPLTRTEVLTRTEEKQISSNLADCPHQQLIDLFASKVPELPKPRIWTGKRHKDMLARWKWVMSQKAADGSVKHQQMQDGVEFFARFFDYVASSDFLTGRSGAWDKCDLPWLMKEENFAKVIEGNYENKGA